LFEEPMASDLVTLFQAEKVIAAAPDWVDRGAEELSVVVPLMVRDVVVEGLLFRAIARTHMPDEMVTFQVEYHPPMKVGGPLCRIEWRPLSGHNNKGLGPKEWRHKNITGCHHHSFDLNHRYAPNEMLKGVLPIALPLEVSPVNFSALLDFAKKELGIDNIEWLGVPPWEPILL
jgi:hypothetical protein